MEFVDRREELSRLRSLARSKESALAVIYGRRRIGKTRLLLEWSRESGGLYTVADQSAPEVQRRYFAEAVESALPGFAEATYPDWRSLLNRLARDARASGWRGPLIFDELPYLVVASPEFPSVLQRWLDHEARDAGLIVAIAGSSQRMMEGLVLSSSAPLYGRARELLALGPIDPSHLAEVFGETAVERSLVELFAAWGGVPRYWELASQLAAPVVEQVDTLVLDPLGVLHREPDRLLIEEVPAALEARPLLDAIGSGCHRTSEIAGRLGRPATSMSRPLQRLLGMGLIRREIPFADSEKKSRRALYKIDDPFVRLWFRVVAPHRGQLASGGEASRRQLLRRFWPELCAQAWEDLCRLCVPRVAASTPLGGGGPWGPVRRWWRGSSAEWDLVSEALDGSSILLGEAKWSAEPIGSAAFRRYRKTLLGKPAPDLPRRYADYRQVRALFVPALAGAEPEAEDLIPVTAEDLVAR